MQHIGGTYEGIHVFGRFDGTGTFEFPSGTRYVGGFRNGQFDGPGTLHFQEGRYDGTWEGGKAIDGTFIFHDGLRFAENDWLYCTGLDRRFHSETCQSEGQVGPAGQVQYSNRDLSQGDNIPPFKLYDVGDGWYDPIRKLVVDQTDPSRTIRTPSPDEIQWIRTHAVCGFKQS